MAVFAWVVLVPLAPALDPVGVAESDQPFLVDGDLTPGNATLMAGEAVSADLLPLRVRLETGHAVTLGPGSQARFWGDLVRFDGVSAAIQAAAGEVLTIETGALRFRTAPGGGAVIYGDRPGAAAAWGVGGPLEVSAGSGEPTMLGPAVAAAFSVTGGELQVQTERAALEIARIQARQLQHLEQLAATRPAVRGRAQPLLRRIADASGGRMRVGDGDNRESASDFNPARLLEVAFEVHRRLLTYAWADSGCGSPDCINHKRVRRPVDFAGWSAATPAPQFGCALCRRAGLGLPGETDAVE